MKSVLFVGDERCCQFAPAASSLLSYHLLGKTVVCKDASLEGIIQAVHSNLNENVRLVVIFSFVEDLLRRENDLSFDNNVGLLRNVVHPNLHRLGSLASMAIKAWKSKLANVEIVWTSPHEIDLIKFNKFILEQNSQDSMSTRELADCKASQECYTRNITCLKSIISSSYPELYFINLDLVLEKLSSSYKIDDKNQNSVLFDGRTIDSKYLDHAKNIMLSYLIEKMEPIKKEAEIENPNLRKMETIFSLDGSDYTITEDMFKYYGVPPVFQSDNASLRGSQYIVEITSGQDKLRKADFYVCILCQKQLKDESLLIKHIEHFAHKLKLGSILSESIKKEFAAIPLKKWNSVLLTRFHEKFIEEQETIQGLHRFCSVSKSNLAKAAAYIKTNLCNSSHFPSFTPDNITFPIKKELKEVSPTEINEKLGVQLLKNDELDFSKESTKTQEILYVTKENFEDMRRKNIDHLHIKNTILTIDTGITLRLIRALCNISCQTEVVVFVLEPSDLMDSVSMLQLSDLISEICSHITISFPKVLTVFALPMANKNQCELSNNIQYLYSKLKLHACKIFIQKSSDDVNKKDFMDLLHSYVMSELRECHSTRTGVVKNEMVNSFKLHQIDEEAYESLFGEKLKKERHAIAKEKLACLKEKTMIQRKHEIEMEKEWEAFRKETSQLQQKVDKFENIKNDIAKQKIELDKISGSLKKEQEDLKREVKYYKTEKDYVLKEKNIIRKEKEFLNSFRKKLDRERSQLTSDQKSLETENKVLKEKVRTLKVIEDELNKDTENVEKVRTEIRELKDRRSMLENSVNQLQDSIDSRKKIVANMDPSSQFTNATSGHVENEFNQKQEPINRSHDESATGSMSFAPQW